MNAGAWPARAKGGEARISDAVVSDALQKLRSFGGDDVGRGAGTTSSPLLQKSVRRRKRPRRGAVLDGFARKVLEAGEDTVCTSTRRRRCAAASEDIGLADPNALNITLTARDAVDFLGMPEGNLALAQAVVYLCAAPKSNALYTAYGAAQEDVERTAQDPVPLHLRNAPTGLMKAFGYGEGYQYAHRT